MDRSFRAPGKWETLGPGQLGKVEQKDREAWAQAVSEVLRRHGDLAAEATWQDLGQMVARFWTVFQTDQSPLSTWGMLSKCTETILRIRVAQKGEQGASGQDALEEFRAFMGEVLGDESREAPEV